MLGGKVTGLDLAPDSLAVAADLWAAEIASGAITVESGDVTALPYLDVAFDVAWTSFVLHHVADPAAPPLLASRRHMGERSRTSTIPLWAGHSRGRCAPLDSLTTYFTSFPKSSWPYCGRRRRRWFDEKVRP